MLRAHRIFLFALLMLVALITSLCLVKVVLAQAFPPPGAGYLDYNYGPAVDGAGRTPTESKPESKLWWNDGFWWGSLWNPTANQYHIYRLNWGAQTWEDTGTVLDDRQDSRGDTLWDATTKKLYIASHFAQLNPSDTVNPTNYARLYRYSYNDTTHTYALDAGFPVNINHDKTEALVLAKDSTGRLWITYVSHVAAETSAKYRVYINASNGNDATWDPNGALDLTTLTNISDTAHVASDDIATIVSFKDNSGAKVGILWSNQFFTTNTSLNFAWHLDSNSSYTKGADWTLQPALNLLAGTNPASKASEHMNIKALRTGTVDQLFAAIKFENQVFVPNQPAYPEIGLLARDVDGTFVYRKYSTVADNDSRPLLMLNENDITNNNDNVIDLFVSGLPQGSKICYKTLTIPPPPARLSTLGQFPSGNCGTNFIVDASGVYTTFRDPSSTKQNVNNTTGLVVLASDVNGQVYGHNIMGNPPSPVPVVHFNSAAYATIEGNTASVTVTLSNPSAFSVAIDYATGDGTATQPADYTTSAGTLTFAPGETSKSFTVSTVNDTFSEANETINLILSNAKGVTLGAPATATLTIIDNDAPPTVQFSPTSYVVNENASTAVLKITLNHATNSPVTVHYATSNGTALAGQDYTAVSDSTITFAPGIIESTVTVPILNDTVYETDETLQVTLSNPSGGVSIGNLGGTATVTIKDDDPMPVVLFSRVTYTVTEGGNANATVILSNPSAFPVTVHYATSDDTAKQPGDYIATSGTLTFTPGETSKNFAITTVDDTLNEDNEAVKLTLSNATNASLSGQAAVATLTISDNDPLPTVQFSATAYSVVENSGKAAIAVQLSAPSGRAVQVHYTTGDGTANAGADYVGVSDNLIILPGQTSVTFDVLMINDSIAEPLETVNLMLNAPVNATLGAKSKALLTIVDDDAAPTFHFSSATYSAGEGDGAATITVTLTAAASSVVTVHYATGDGTATAGQDYTATSGVLTFAPGEFSQMFTMSVTQDTMHELNETISLTLTTPSGNATLATPNKATLTLIDDDPPPLVQFSRGAYTVTEGNEISVAVNLSNPSAFSVTVDYATSDGTAKQPIDYATNTGTLIFAPGETSKRFIVKTVDDTLNEDDKTVNLALSNVNNASLSEQGAAAMLTIVDNDPPPTIQFSAANDAVAENAGKAAIQVTLSSPSGRTVYVHYRTSDDSAVSGVDYVGLDANLVIPSGQTSATLAIDIMNDNWSEPDKTVNLLLDTPVNALLGAIAQATLTIQDDDPAPTIQFSRATYTVTEGSIANITVILSNPSISPVTVNYATSNGTAITGQDYTATSGMLIFAPGGLSRSFSVPILQDNLHEPNKTVNLTLNSSTNGTLGATATLLLIILDDDPASTNSAVYLPIICH